MKITLTEKEVTELIAEHIRKKLNVYNVVKVKYTDDFLMRTLKPGEPAVITEIVEDKFKGE